MYPTTSKKSEVSTSYGGLNGWFGRFIHKAIDTVLDYVAVAVPVLGPIISKAIKDKIEELTDHYSGGWWSKPAADYEPTVAEQAVITAWLNSKFTAWYTALAKQYSDALSMELQNQVEQVNSITIKMSVMTDYLNKSETAGLSPDGVKARAELVSQLFAPLQDMIAQWADENQVGVSTVTFTATSANNTQFKPLAAALSGSYSVKKYVNTTNTPESLPDLGSNPRNTTTTGGTKTPVPSATTPASTSTATTTKTTSSGNNTLLAMLALAGLGFLVLGGKKKQKKSKS